MLFWKDDKKKDDGDKKKRATDDKGKKSRPWYDISSDDLLEYDMMDDD